MKVVLFDNNIDQVCSINVREDDYEWLANLINEYNDLYYYESGIRPLEIIAKERIFKESEIVEKC